MINKFSFGRYFCTLIIVVLGFLYALPNVYDIHGADPALQIKGRSSLGGVKQVEVTSETVSNVLADLKAVNIPVKRDFFKDKSVVVSFYNDVDQSKAKDLLQDKLGVQYIVAQTLQTKTPTWLLNLGAEPMKHGLDLQGGVHFLMGVGVTHEINKEINQGQADAIQTALQDQVLKKEALNQLQNGRFEGNFCVSTDGRTCANSAASSDSSVSNTAFISPMFNSEAGLENAIDFLSSSYDHFQWQQIGKTFQIMGTLKPTYVEQERQAIMKQVVQTLGQRVNQLGVSDASVVQQGVDRVAIDLPGIQDAAQAKDILGKTASLEFHIVPNAQATANEGPKPTEVLTDENTGQPVTMNTQIVLKGSSITGASANLDQNGMPVININLSGDLSLFNDATIAAAKNGQDMATVFIEDVPTITKETLANGQVKDVVTYHSKREVINVARVIQGLGAQFQIQGLPSMQDAEELALLLRAGSLSAPVAPLEEEVVGPTLGAHNVALGIGSIAIGFVAIIIFMLIYYSVFGIIANIALFANLCLQMAVLSVLHASLTLPGIAGIVLTLGMAVDANVLIYERIREELRLGNTIQSSLHVGFEKAFVTILDANVTTLIVAGVLFWMGAGPVQGFAVTLSIGIITSVFTAVMVTRALVNLIYGGRVVKKLRIGIKIKPGTV